MPSVPFRRASLLAALLALLAHPALAGIIEQVVDLPVKVTDAAGKPVEQTIKLTIARDDARPRSGFLVLNHGRSGDPAQRRTTGRFQFSDTAAYFINLGYAVFIPTRIGYGPSGGPDVEDTGPCRAKSYAPALEAAAQQTLAVIAHARAQPYIDPANGLLVGNSVGGITTIATAAKSPPGIRAAINFAGGAGGDPANHPARPCRDDLLTAAYATFGATTRIPTLWLYSENDRFFGIQSPRSWLAAFQAQGGTGRFVQLPTHGQDGHTSFINNRPAWKPDVEAFIAALR